MDGATWAEYGLGLEANLRDLHARVHRGAYRARPSRRVFIPKPDGRLRPLGIAALEDKILQRALVEVLNAICETDFLGFSYGFRPGRSPHHALDALAAGIVGKRVNWVLDADFSDYFDRVQHDALMARVARRVHDKRVLKLTRRYLEAGVMEGGLVHASEEGTPQGSPLSPLLSNIMLDDLDWELEKRGHRFVRYADDGRIYVRSERAGQRVTESITRSVEQRLKLRVNRQKSKVAPAVDRRVLGFQFFRYRDGRIGVTVVPKALKRAQDRIRQLTTRNWGVSMERRVKEINRFTVGWTAYFASADSILPFEKLEKWLRRRLRQVRWKEW